MTKALSLLLAVGLLAGSPAKSAKPAVTVSLTAATMGDDCGPGVVTEPIPEPVKPTPVPAGNHGESGGAGIAKDSGESAHESRAPRRCQQSSMQLSVISPAGAAKSELKVKKVELYDQNGVLVGELTPKAPSVWTKDVYKPWDQTIKTGQSLSVSYALSKPSWGGVLDPYSQTYTLKVVVSIGGADQALEHEATMFTETSLPPGVVT